MIAQKDDEFLTIAEAARLLKVSAVTIKRWLKQGILPAYHVGPRHVRIRYSDLAKVLTPLVREEVKVVREIMPIKTELTIRPLSQEEAKERLAAIKEAKAFREEVLSERGGKPFSPSWPLIRRAREERSRTL